MQIYEINTYEKTPAFILVVAKSCFLPAVASAIVAEYAIDSNFKGLSPISFPTGTMIGGFAKYVSTKNVTYQPMTSSLIF